MPNSFQNQSQAQQIVEKQFYLQNQGQGVALGSAPASLPLMEQISVALCALETLGDEIRALECRHSPGLSFHQETACGGGMPCAPSSDPAAIEGMRSILNRLASYSSMLNEITTRVRV